MIQDLCGQTPMTGQRRYADKGTDPSSDNCVKTHSGKDQCY